MTRRTLLAVVGLTLVGAIIRFATLDVQSFWLDEAVTADVVGGSLTHMLHAVRDGESTPYLYYLVAWGWGNVFGAGEVGLRSLSALFGTATIPVAYLAGERLEDRRTGLATAGVVAVSPLAVHYSQEARAYALLVLAAALTFVAFGSLYRAAGSRRRMLAFWSGSCCLALLTHYFAVFLVAAEALVLAVRRAELRRGVLLALVPVGVTGLLLLPLAREQRSHGFADWIADDTLVTRVAQVVKQSLVGLDGPAERLTTTLAAAMAVTAVVCLVRWGNARRREAALVAAAVGGLAILWPLLAALAGSDYFNARNVVATFVPLAVIIGTGLASHSRIGAVVLASYTVLSLVILATVAVNVRYQRDDWRDLARDLGPATTTRAIVVAPDDGRIPLEYYRPRAVQVGPRGAIVREVVFVAMGRKVPGGGSSAPQPSTVAPPFPGLRLTQLRRASTYTILSYRSARPFRVRAGGVPNRFDNSSKQGLLIEKR
jgi:mannosyltransferase